MAARVLITGASSGIGRALAEVFAEAGHALVLVARREQRLEEAAMELRTRYGVEVVIETADLSKTKQVHALHKRMQKQGLEIEILVNNAGRGDVGRFMDVDEASDQQTLELNVLAPTLLCKLFGRDMVARGRGRILNVASLGGFVPGPHLAVYIASKHYLLTLSEALNDELRPHGISVTASCPGPTESEFHKKAGTGRISLLPWVKMMDAYTVAEQAYAATMAGESVVVHGLLNKLVAQAPRLAPRALMTRVAGAVMHLRR